MPTFSFAKTEVFFGTFFTDESSVIVKQELFRLGAEKGAKIELGKIIRGAPYFHFKLPRETLPSLFEFLNKKGNLILENSQFSEIEGSEYVRFIIWQAPANKFKKLTDNNLYIHRVIPNPDSDREKIISFLNFNEIKYTGQKVLSFTLRKNKDWNQLAEILNESGSYLIHQNNIWLNKKIKMTFSQGEIKNKKFTTTLKLTVTSVKSEEATKLFLDKVGRSINVNTWSLANRPETYLKLSESGTLSVIPSQVVTNKAELKLSSILNYLKPQLTKKQPDSAVTQDQTQKIQNSKTNISIENEIAVKQTETEQQIKAREIARLEQLQKSKYPFKYSLGNDSIFLETDSLKNNTTVLQNSKLRGYYPGKSQLFWNNKLIEIKDNEFEVVWESPLANYQESSSSLSSSENSIKIQIKKFPANEISFAGSAFMTANKEIATMAHLEYERWIERFFNKNRSTYFFDRLSLTGYFTQITKAVENKNYQDTGIKLKFLAPRNIQERTRGLTSTLNLHNLVSGPFNALSLGVNLEFELNFPFPLFEYWPKTISVFGEFDLWGPGLTIRKSFFMGLKGKMYFTENFYLHGRAGRLEQDMTQETSTTIADLAFGITRFEGGFGYKF